MTTEQLGDPEKLNFSVPLHFLFSRNLDLTRVTVTAVVDVLGLCHHSCVAPMTVVFCSLLNLFLCSVEVNLAVFTCHCVFSQGAALL